MKLLKELLLITAGAIAVVTITVKSAALDERGAVKFLEDAAIKVKLPNSIGSGSFIREDIVLTNRHVITPSKDGKVVIETSSGDMEGKVIAIAEDDIDLALIKVNLPSKFKPHILKLADTEPPKGSKLYALGMVGNSFQTLHTGFKTGYYDGYTNTNMQFSFGTSGSAVIDDKGYIIGIATAMQKDLNFYLLTDLEDIKYFLKYGTNLEE